MKKGLLTPRDLSSLIEDDVCQWLNPISCIKDRNCSGGAGPEMVKKALIKTEEEVTS
jgi:argininosuccinate lyase